MSTAIIGAGIIGVSTAYYLSQSPQYTTAQGNDPKNEIYLVDASSQLFTSASGFAAGFLAKDWFSPSAAALGALSFDLHRQLASEFGGRERWGYSPSTSISPFHNIDGKRGDEWLDVGNTRASVAPRDGEEEGGGAPSWLNATQTLGVEVLSTGETTAQIDPPRLCKFLLDACLSRGVRLHHPVRPVALFTTPAAEQIAGIRVQRSETGQILTLPCSRIVIAAGAWSGNVFKTLFPSAPEALPVSSLAGHSLLVRSPRWTAEEERRGCHAVFAVDNNEGFSPEIFSRLGGEIYVAGLNHSASELPLPDLPEDSIAREQHMNCIERVAGKLISGSKTIRKSLCFRPIITNRSTPIVSRISDRRLGNGVSTDEGGGVFVATGHGPWGISMSLGTGKVVAEMVEGRKTSGKVVGKPSTVNSTGPTGRVAYCLSPLCSEEVRWIRWNFNLLPRDRLHNRRAGFAAMGLSPSKNIEETLEKSSAFKGAVDSSYEECMILGQHKYSGLQAYQLHDAAVRVYEKLAIVEDDDVILKYTQKSLPQPPSQLDVDRTIKKEKLFEGGKLTVSLEDFRVFATTLFRDMGLATAYNRLLVYVPASSLGVIVAHAVVRRLPIVGPVYRAGGPLIPSLLISSVIGFVVAQLNPT